MSCSPSVALRNGLRLLLPLSVVITVYLYLYPVFHSCAFPLPPAASILPDSHGGETTLTTTTAFRETLRLHNPFERPRPGSDENDEGAAVGSRLAPFRLLALGDPQLEGDTSIPNAHGFPFPHLLGLLKHATFQTSQPGLRERLRHTLHDTIDFVLEDIPFALFGIQKRIDLFGNDFYLAHIYRTLHWWARPTHVTVLGDLLGSQWLDDDEFDRRGNRFWTRVFRGGERVPDDIARTPADEYDLAGYLGGPGPEHGGGSDTGFMEEDTDTAWSRRIINVAGNHDIGYAGDLSEERLARFERVFGKANYELRFELSPTQLSAAGLASVYDGTSDHDNGFSDRLHPELRLLVLNDMNLDTPAQSSELQDQTYAFINAAINTASDVEFLGHYTIVLTHVPLHKPDGVCVDAPFFSFHEHDGTLREQNLLSADASRGFLEGIYGFHADTMAPGSGRGRHGIVLNGHDHEGCDTWHFLNRTNGTNVADRPWQARRWADALGHGIPGHPGMPGLREITLRSMMGEFGGNAGLLSVWFDEAEWQWKADFATCPLGKQHGWWAVHIIDLITLAALLAYAVLAVLKAAGKDVDH